MAESKAALTLNLYGNIFVPSHTPKLTYQCIPNTLNYIQSDTKVTPLQALLGFSDTEGPILLTDAQNKQR